MFNKSFDKVANSYDKFMQFYKLYMPKELFNFLDTKTPSNILDCGAGTGEYSHYFANKGFKVTSLDISKKMLSKVQKHKNITTIVDDIMTTEKLVPGYTGIMCCDFLHHIEDLSCLLPKFNNYVDSNGWILVYDFNPKNFFIKLLGLFERLLFGKVFYRSLEELSAYFEKETSLKLCKSFENKHYYFALYRRLQ